MSLVETIVKFVNKSAYIMVGGEAAFEWWSLT